VVQKADLPSARIELLGSDPKETSARWAYLGV
jgi:hypothetical protein